MRATREAGDDGWRIGTLYPQKKVRPAWTKARRDAGNLELHTVVSVCLPARTSQDGNWLPGLVVDFEETEGGYWERKDHGGAIQTRTIAESIGLYLCTSN